MMTVETGNSGNGLKTGTTLYALTNEFVSRRYSFEDLLAEIAARGIGPGLEIVGFQSIRGFPDITDEFADRFKELTSKFALVPTSLAINADQEIRRGKLMSEDEMVAYHEPQLRAAAKLGFPIARYQYGAGPGAIRRLAPLAEELNVKLGLEIHAPQHANHPEVLRYREMYYEVQSPNLGWIPDFSSTVMTPPPSFFTQCRESGVPEMLIEQAIEFWQADGDVLSRLNQYRQLARAHGFNEVDIDRLSMIFFIFGRADPLSWRELMPQVVHIHGKFFGFDMLGNEECIDYPKLLHIFKEGGFNGYISSEWEGHIYSNADAFSMIEQHQALCKKILTSGTA